MTAAIAY